MSAENFYEGREQTKIKHFILREYLERFALIVQSFANSITYIDCFSGPWNLQSQDFQDSSFAIAIDQLKRAKATLAEKGKQLALRCMLKRIRKHSQSLRRSLGRFRASKQKRKTKASKGALRTF